MTVTVVGGHGQCVAGAVRRLADGPVRLDVFSGLVPVTVGWLGLGASAVIGQRAALMPLSESRQQSLVTE